MKRKRVIAMAAVSAAAALSVPAAGLARADTSGGVCTGFDRAIEYHEWRAGTSQGPYGPPTPDAIDSQDYLRSLYAWYHANNCNVALNKRPDEQRPLEPPCYLPDGCLRLWGPRDDDFPRPVENQS